MQNTLLQKTLKTLSPKELKSFTDFLVSPYLNGNKKVIAYWGEIKKFAPDFFMEDKQKERIATKVFETKKYNDAQYRNLVSDTMQFLLDFLGYEELKKNDAHLLFWKAEASYVRNFAELQEKTLKSLRDKKEKLGTHNQLELEMEIWIERFTKLLLQKKTMGKQESASLMRNATLINSYLNNALVKIFINYVNSIRAEDDFNVPFNKEGMKMLLAVYESNLFDNHPLVNAYYFMLKLSAEKKDADYFVLKKILLKSESYSKIDRIHIALNLQLFLANIITTGLVFWRKELFELYDYELKNELWLDNKPLTYIAFFNITSNALSLHKIDYAETFVREYSSKLISPVKNEIVNLCEAHILFYKNKPADALNILSKIQTENLLIKLELRTLQAMIFYERGETEALDSLLESFRHFLQYQNTVVTPASLAHRYEFCKDLSKLNKLQMDPDKKGADKFLKNLTGRPGALMQEWLIAHLKKLF